jgi:hypothetical protein
MMAVAELSDEHVREVAHAVLQRSDYAEWHRDEALQAWLEQLWRWLEQFNFRMADLSANQPLLYWAIVGGLLLTSALLLAHVVWTIRAALTTAAPARPPADAGGGSLAAEADALARQGRFLEAARRLQLAAIDLLLRDRMISLSRFEPNRVLRRRLERAALPAAERQTLLALVDRLETAWFRDRVDDAELYRSWGVLYQRLAARTGAA